MSFNGTVLFVPPGTSEFGWTMRRRTMTMTMRRKDEEDDYEDNKDNNDVNRRTTKTMMTRMTKMNRFRYL